MASKRKAAARAKSGARRACSAKKAPRARAQSKGLTLRGVAPSFTVNDLAESLAWYQRRPRVRRRGALGAGREAASGCRFSAGDVTFMIGQDDWKKGRDREEGRGLSDLLHDGAGTSTTSRSASRRRAESSTMSRRTSPGACATSP